MPKAEFFNRPRPDLERVTFESEVYGTIILEKMATQATMSYQALYTKKLELYGPDSETCFAPVGGEPVDLTESWAQSAAAIVVMQKQPMENRYSFEEIIASSITDEDEYNRLVLTANMLNTGEKKAKSDTEPQSSVSQDDQ